MFHKCICTCSLDEENEFHTYAAAHPFKVVPANSSRISNFSKVAFEIPVNPGVGGSNETNPYITVSPEAVGTQVSLYHILIIIMLYNILILLVFGNIQFLYNTKVLKHLMDITAAFLGHRQVKNAVIAVPAKFDSIQRQATGAAFKAAGLKVIRVLEEPTAAAVAYKLHKKKNIHHILVYDFGGGTLDVSLLYVSKGSVQVYATDGDDMLGGSDLDLCLYNVVKSKVEIHIKNHVQGLSDYFKSHQKTENNNKNTKLKSTESNLDNIDTNIDMRELCISNNLRNKAESIKKQLTYNATVTSSCVYPTKDLQPSSSYINTNNKESISEISFTVTINEFETECKPLFDRAMLPVYRLLKDLEMQKEEVDEVVLVGGSTRIPKVKKMLREYFEKELNDHIDPDVTVAYGAASIND